MKRDVFGWGEIRALWNSEVGSHTWGHSQQDKQQMQNHNHPRAHDIFLEQTGCEYAVNEDHGNWCDRDNRVLFSHVILCMYYTIREADEAECLLTPSMNCIFISGFATCNKHLRRQTDAQFLRLSVLRRMFVGRLSTDSLRTCCVRRIFIIEDLRLATNLSLKTRDWPKTWI